MEETKDKSFLGAGWGFPPEFRRDSRSVELVSDEEDIRQSLYLLVSTAPGERIMRPSYGCDLQSMVFERLTEATRTKIEHMVLRAIILFEPRVSVQEVNVHFVSHETGMIHIVVDYTIIQTNTRSNIVYPFYLKEGTNVQI
jgi:uncharacterized protein